MVPEVGFGWFLVSFVRVLEGFGKLQWDLLVTSDLAGCCKMLSCCMLLLWLGNVGSKPSLCRRRQSDEQRHLQLLVLRMHNVPACYCLFKVMRTWPRH